MKGVREPEVDDGGTQAGWPCEIVGIGAAVDFPAEFEAAQATGTHFEGI